MYFKTMQTLRAATPFDGILYYASDSEPTTEIPSSSESIFPKRTELANPENVRPSGVSHETHEETIDILRTPETESVWILAK